MCSYNSFQNHFFIPVKLNCNIQRESHMSHSRFSCGSSILSYWNLERWFLWREENQRTLKKKTLKQLARTNNKLNQHDDGSRNQTQDTLVGGQRSHHCAIPAPQKSPKGHKSPWINPSIYPLVHLKTLTKFIVQVQGLPVEEAVYGISTLFQVNIFPSSVIPEHCWDFDIQKLTHFFVLAILLTGPSCQHVSNVRNLPWTKRSKEHCKTCP